LSDSSRDKDDVLRTISISVASVACVASFCYPGYGMGAVAVILTLCLSTLNEIWQRAEALRFMMESRLDRDRTLRPDLDSTD
jgi:hypothetical protein